MHQSGIENVVASGGTALTKPQIWLIKRFTSNITVLYDGDAAGIHAALRGIDMFLEAGFNVKVVLLPDGEDPDSYAQNHDSTEFIRYIEDHQTDFIRFKSALLSKEAGDDPFKRAELIKDITASIAIIPDMITRQVYIRDCAERLHMEEKVLTTEVVNLRRKNREEDVKKEAKEEKKQEATTAVNMPAKPVSALEQNYYNLIQLIVRYGERHVEIEDTVYTIGDVIIYTLEGDEIKAPQPVYQTIIDEFKRHSKDEGFKAETFFKFHPDPQVSALAIDMIADKYRFVKADSEARLGELVTQLLYEIKLTVVNIQIEEVEKWLKEAQANNDWERQMQLLAHQPELLAQRNEICKILGNRVISI
jgi:DNA primase